MCSNIKDIDVEIIELFSKNIDIKTISLQLNISEKRVIKKLRQNLSENDIKQIIEYYLNDKFEDI